MGWHRGGWLPLRPGMVIPDGPEGTAFFTVLHADEPTLLVLHSTTHVPVSLRERFGLHIDWCWTFALAAAPAGGTRMLIRNRARVAPWWLAAAYAIVLIPADHVMARGMLRGLDKRSAA